MEEIAVYSSSPPERERIMAALARLGLSALDLNGADVDAVVEAITSAPAEVVIVETAGEMDRMTLLVEAALAAGKQVIAIVTGIADCERVAAAGVSDFVVEPFSSAELEARIGRLLKQAPDAGAVTVEGLSIIPGSYEASIDGCPLKLTFKEFELLKHLASNPGRVLTRQALLNQIWEYDYYGGTRTVDVHVRRLRAKLGSRYGGFIKTVRQVGYKFDV